MMGYLRPYYEVISIDLPGMGASGRPAGVTFRDFEDTISYFEERIKKWAQITGIGQNGQKFYLLGHSMGGLLAGHYALRNPNQIEGLVLMSAVGVSPKPAHLDGEAFVN